MLVSGRCGKGVLWLVVGVNGVVGYSRPPGSSLGSSSSSGGTMPMDQQHKRQRNYRLIVDPALKQGPTKLYSIEGHIPGVSDDICQSIIQSKHICEGLFVANESGALHNGRD